MRIAISGAHSLGKSTLVNDWVQAHPEYIREEEPFRALAAMDYEILFRQECNRLHNGIQLFYNASRINSYSSPADNVIFDRCPVDYIAYSQYTANHGSTDITDQFVKAMECSIRDSLRHLDLLVFIPMSESWPVAMEDDGIRPIDLPYRDEVDAIFKEIYRHRRFDVFPEHDAPRFIELSGSRTDRVHAIEAALFTMP
jgi:predicted ATPase